MKPTLSIISVLIISLCLSAIAAASPAKPVVELLEHLAKRGVKITPDAVVAVERAFARHGDDALKAFRDAGGGLAEAAARHGDEVVTAALRVPDAAPMLARRADELLPLVRSHGDDILKLEAKVPGLAADAVRLYPEAADITRLARLEPDVAARTLSYASKATEPAVRKQLLLAVEKHGPGFLERLSPTRIMAYGLSAAMITTAVAVGVQAPETLAETAQDIASKIATACAVVIGGVGLLAAVYFMVPLILAALVRRRLRPGSRRNQVGKTIDIDTPNT